MTTRRKSEMWISNNRVLVGGIKKVHGRNPNFETEETKLLISLWGDPKIQKTLITTHKKHPVICRLADKMREFGYVRSPEEINTRIKNLKCFYNRIKKDLDMGLMTEPTWKHYAAMDEIMTRPIFSVRPDEIPKPSSRYKQEQEAENAAEAEAEKASEKTEDTEDEDDESSKPDSLFDEAQIQSRDEPDDDVEIEETTLIEPKLEPIEVDDDPEDEVEVNTKAVATLNSTTQPNKLITTKTNTNEVNTANTLSNALKLAQPIMFTSPPQNQQQPQGKISLVPTNFLMQQPQSQIQIRPPAQHILYAKPSTIQNNQAIATSVQGGNMPMKLLFVNALQNNSQKPVPCNTTDTTPQTINTVKTTVLPTNTTFLTNGNSDVKTTTSGKVEKKRNRCGPAFRALLNDLIRHRKDEAQIAKERLELEKQRFEFEKTIGAKILEAIEALKPSSSAAINKIDDPAVTENTNITTIPLLVPKIEKDI